MRDALETASLGIAHPSSLNMSGGTFLDLTYLRNIR